MSYNGEHYSTFMALLQMWGLPMKLAESISKQLANIDNAKQDELIKTLTVELHKRQSSM